MDIRKPMIFMTALLLIFLPFCVSAGEPAPSGVVPFASFGDAVNAEDSHVYFSADYCIVLAQAGGSWWRLDAQVDEQYKALYDAFMGPEQGTSAADDFRLYLTTLPFSAVRPEEQPLTGGSLAGYAGKTPKDLLADGFGFDWMQASAADEIRASGDAECVILKDDAGNEYRVPLYLVYSDYPDSLLFCMSKGIYSYYFYFDSTEADLRKAAGDGSWTGLKIAGASFCGFSAALTRSFFGNINARPEGITGEQAAAIRTVKDAKACDCICFFQDDINRFVVVVVGEDCFWRCSAEFDEQYRALVRAQVAAEEGEKEAAEAAADEYLNSLPVTVEKVEGVPVRKIGDLAPYIGKSVRELLADGFEPVFFFATSTDPSRESFGIPLSLDDGRGRVYSLSGTCFLNEFNQEIILYMNRDLFQYEFIFDGDLDALEAAVRDGTVLDLAVREANRLGVTGKPEDFGIVR